MIPRFRMTIPKDRCEGHLEAGADKVVVSAPFKIKDTKADLGGSGPGDDWVTTVMGINDNDYDPRHHKIVSNASCTTTCLAHMMKPLINFLPRKILSASMATVHGHRLTAGFGQAAKDRGRGSEKKQKHHE